MDGSEVDLSDRISDQNMEEQDYETVCDETTESESLEEFKTYRCTKCKERFSMAAQLQEHEEKHNLGLICPSCGYEGASKSSMIVHSRSHLDEESVQCLVCRERLPGEEKLDAHIAAHAKSMASCPWCPYVGASGSGLKKHLDHHLSNFRVNCNFCKYFAFSEGELRAHHSAVHETSLRQSKRWTVSEKTKAWSLGGGGEPAGQDFSRLVERAVYRCGLCGGRQTGKAAYESHLAGIVEPGLAYCPHCTFRTDDRDRIVEHVLSHLREPDEVLRLTNTT